MPCPKDAETLNALDQGAFNKHYLLVRAQHRHWWSDRHQKAEKIMRLEAELKLPKEHRYSLQELMAMDTEALDMIHEKADSAVTQKRFEDFAAKDRNKFASQTASGLRTIE